MSLSPVSFGVGPSPQVHPAVTGAVEPLDSVALGSATPAKAGRLASLAAGTKFITYGAIYKAEGKLTELREKKYCPLDNLPVPTISVPFVLVPGWTTTTEAFQPLVEYLTRDGANGGTPIFVKQGAFFTKDADGNLQAAASVPAGSKVFEMVLSDTHQGPDKNVVEMRQNFDAIQKLTGAAQVDAEGYSQGGLDSRLYVDQGGTAIRRLILLGTPNRGTQFAALAKDVLDKQVGWAEKFGGISENDRGSLEWLSPETQSQPLADLNSRWDDQRKKLPIITIGADLLPTPRFGGYLTSGDGLVPAGSLELPNSETIVLHDAMLHGRLNDDETVQHLRSIFFGWSLPVTDVFPPDQEEADRVRTFLANWKPAQLPPPVRKSL